MNLAARIADGTMRPLPASATQVRAADGTTVYLDGWRLFEAKSKDGTVKMVWLDAADKYRLVMPASTWLAQTVAAAQDPVGHGTPHA